MKILVLSVGSVCSIDKTHTTQLIPLPSSHSLRCEESLSLSRRDHWDLMVTQSDPSQSVTDTNQTLIQSAICIHLSNELHYEYQNIFQLKYFFNMSMIQICWKYFVICKLCWIFTTQSTHLCVYGSQLMATCVTADNCYECTL